MSDERSGLPIAVFDSGIGGLTVLHELLVSLPEEDYLYLGDTAGFPYGNKAGEWLRPRIEQLVRFLLDRGAKLLVIACNSATAAGGDVVRTVAAEHGVEVLTVVEPEAEIAAAITRFPPDRGPRHADHGGGRRLPACARADGRSPELDVIEVAAPRPRADHPERLPVRRGGDRDRSLLLRAVPRGRGRHPDPRLHPLPAGGADAPADPRPRRPPGHRRPRACGRRAAHARGGGAGDRPPGGGRRTASSARATCRRSASSARGSCRCPSARSSTWISRRRPRLLCNP